MNNVQAQWSGAGPVFPVEGHIPRLTHMLFQGMFFIITPALMVGAFAERMKFSTMVVFMILWGTLVYCPLCHWVWDSDGILFYGGVNAGVTAGGALDFAGGTVVHISSGISALVCALADRQAAGIRQRADAAAQPDLHGRRRDDALGRLVRLQRRQRPGGQRPWRPAPSPPPISPRPPARWPGPAMEWITRGKPSVLGACSGLVAGLVCITPGSGFRAADLGHRDRRWRRACVCFFACTALKSRFGYDDSLDVFGVHGVGGTLGAILTGVFATRVVNNVADGEPVGLLEGGSVLIGQIIATAITWALAIVVTFVLLKVLDATMGLRVSQAEEIEGLDMSQHGEEGYIFL